MARGWESKAIESQMEDAAEKAAGRGSPLNSEQTELRQKRDGLLLSRTRILRDLETSRHPRYRRMLQEALAHLERELAEID